MACLVAVESTIDSENVPMKHGGDHECALSRLESRVLGIIVPEHANLLRVAFTKL